MNVETNHVVSADDLKTLIAKDAAFRDQYQPVPARFNREARKAIDNGGYPSADSTLLVWAAKKRTKERKRRKLAKAAKRRNRA